jgi:hypothetical protein
MMTFLRYLIAGLCVTALMLSAVPASAAPDWWPLVPCGLNAEPAGKFGYTEPCNRCDIFKLLKNLIDFVLVGLMPILATLFFVIAGFHIVLAGGNMSSVARGKQIFWDTVKAVAILSISWLLVNTLIRSLARDQNVASNWWKFECRATVKPPTRPVPITGPQAELCNDTAALAKKYDVPASAKDSEALKALIACVTSDPVNQYIDQAQMYTTERTNDKCNYTRGEGICGSCAHSQYSCHYGGRTGSDGAEAVDFNAKGISEQELYDKLRQLYTKCSFGYIGFEDNHIHVSTKSCDGN